MSQSVNGMEVNQQTQSSHNIQWWYFLLLIKRERESIQHKDVRAGPAVQGDQCQSDLIIMALDNYNPMILHATNSAIDLKRIYVYWRSITISTMHKHPHRSISKMLQSERQLKPKSFHNACKHVAHHNPIILYHEINSAIYLERV